MPGLVSTLLNQTDSMPSRLVQTFLQVIEQVWHPIHLSRLSTMAICARTFILPTPSLLRCPSRQCRRSRWRHHQPPCRTSSLRSSCAQQRIRHDWRRRSEEHTSELQSLMRISYAVFCLKKNTQEDNQDNTDQK